MPHKDVTGLVDKLKTQKGIVIDQKVIPGANHFFDGKISASGSRSRRTRRRPWPKLGVVPKEAAATIWEKGSKAVFDVARIDAIEREVKHDVIAFLTHLAEIVGPEARFVHQGMTSSDVLDTCFNVQLVRAADLLLADLDALLAALKRRAFEHKMTPTIGRSHGIHAEPTTFGLKLAQAYAEFERGMAPPDRGAAGGGHLRHLGRGRHLRQHRSAGRGIRRREDGADRSSRSRRRSSRATATPCTSRRSP